MEAVSEPIRCSRATVNASHRLRYVGIGALRTNLSEPGAGTLAAGSSGVLDACDVPIDDIPCDEKQPLPLFRAYLRDPAVSRSVRPTLYLAEDFFSTF